MAVIHLLDNFTINKIAAGEVVERPASVVKELVENSIDAGSTAITIEIENGGTSLIRVTDNGIGMDKDDAVVSFKRHATSKINEHSDLYRINSLGFRGEALASIASVSQVEMFTRTKDNLSGFHVINHGGKIIKAVEAGCPEGTTLIVKNLFYNTPARLKFLKSERTEAAKISELISKLILARPDISIKYINQGKTVYHSEGNSDLLSSILTVYGSSIKHEIIEIENYSEDKTVSIKGYIGKQSLSRLNRNHQTFIVNGRYVKSIGISQTLEEAYKTQLMINHYPWAVLHIEMPVDEIDVNVHPAKTEVRFKNEGHLFNLLLEWFKNALMENEKGRYLSKSNDIDSKAFLTYKDESSFTEPGKDSPGNVIDNNYKVIDNNCKENWHLPVINNQDEFVNEQMNIFINTDKRKDIDENISASCIKESIFDNNLDDPDELSAKIVGCIFDTYIVIEKNDFIYLLDQHAAHERLLFERYKEMIRRQNTVSQQLLPPYVLELTHDEFIQVNNNIEIFTTAGFEIEGFGGKAFIIRAIPMLIKDINIKELFMKLLDSIDDKKRDYKSNLVIEDIIMLACKSAVKAHQKLTNMEIINLLKELRSKDMPMTCPHGRPIMITISKYEIEKKFKRIQ